VVCLTQRAPGDSVRPRRPAGVGARPLNFSVRPPRDAAVILRVKVRPCSRSSSLTQESDGTWRAQLKSPPVDGKANEELVALIATHFKCRKADVVIKSGASGRIKLVRVDTP